MPRMHEEEGLPVIGSALSMARAPHMFMADLALRHGGIASFRTMNRRVVVVTDPDMIHELLVTKWQRFVRGRQSVNLGIIGKGLLTMTGEEWFDRRRLAQGAFTRDMLKEVARRSCISAEAVLGAWDAERQGDGTVSLEAGMLQLSMSLIASMLLSSDIDSAEAERIGGILRYGLQLVHKRNTALWAPPVWLPTPNNRGLLKVRHDLTEFIKNNIAKRSTNPGEFPDLHRSMAEARDPRTGRGFAPDALIDETKTLFFAGYETVATSMTWVLYLLASHEDVAGKLHAELADVLGDRTPTGEDLPRLPYLRAVVQEAMRVYPPVYVLPRRAIADEEIGGYSIRGDTIVFASVNGLHRSAIWGDDRELFRPQRFLKSNWPRRAYMPFGAGRHLCIGADFAMTEMSLAVAMIVRRYRLSTTSVVGTKARITLVPDGPIRLKLVAT